jgi:type III secretion system low calcium response chaperone LcrH/SycD
MSNTTESQKPAAKPGLRRRITPDILNLVTETVKNAEPYFAKRGLQPEQMEALYTAGYNFYTAGRYQDACNIFRLLCSYDHTNPRNWIALGGAAQHIDNHRSAGAAFTFAAILNPADPIPQIHAADSFIALKDFAQAERCARAVLTLCGDKPEYAAVKSRAAALVDALKVHLN